VLVLTRYQSEMAAILEAFPQVQKFDESRMSDWKAGNIPVWVANPASLSHGIDGVQKSCSTIVRMSLSYSLEQYIQTNARILRTGQDTQAKIYRILGENTVDFVVANALEEKSGNQSALMQAVKMLQRANSEPQTPPLVSKPSCERLR
jgi:SNF2 family DNA or RNA helicase